jgi:formate hydrogenlyase subunit 3/multisubunit Na+/H+ antiporter MnhD subunit
MLKIWRFAFQRVPNEEIARGPASAGSGPLLAAVGLILALGLAAGPVYDYCLSAATALLDGSVYNDALLAAANDPASALR